MVDIPPRRATDAYLAGMGERLDHVCDVDLGELVEGHHVVVRGIRRSPDGDELHYEFVPGIAAAESDEKGAFLWLWTLSVSDDQDTPYKNDDVGAFDDESGGEASHGTRDLGGAIPADARRLTMVFEPPPEARDAVGRTLHWDLDRDEIAVE